MLNIITKHAEPMPRRGSRKGVAPRRAGEHESWKPLPPHRNFSWMVAGITVSAVSRWGIIVALAQVGSVAMIGQFVFAFACCAPLAALSKLGCRVAMVTDARREFQFGDYLGLRLVMTVCFMAAALGVAIWGHYESQLTWVILIVALATALELASDMFRALMQHHERMHRNAIALMIQGPLTLALLAAAVCLTGSLLWGVVALPLVAAGMLFGFDLPGARRLLSVTTTPAGGPSCSRAAIRLSLRPRWQAGSMWQLAWLGLPLGIATTITALTNSVPRYMVGCQLGEHALGLFGAILSLGALQAVVVLAMQQSTIPRLSRYYAEGDLRAFCRLAGRQQLAVTLLGVGLVATMMFAGRPLLNALFGAEFGDYADLGVSLMIASSLLCFGSSLGSAVNAMRRFKIHLLIQLGGIATLLALLPDYLQARGLLGVAVAMQISALIAIVFFGLALFKGLWRVDRVGRKRTDWRLDARIAARVRRVWQGSKAEPAEEGGSNG